MENKIYLCLKISDKQDLELFKKYCLSLVKKKGLVFLLTEEELKNGVV